MLLHAGKRINHELCLTHELGAGTMGTIWAANHLRLGRQVAVKFISEELLATNPQARDRFNREAIVLADFRHPHVVELIGTGTTDNDTPFIVLELMAGEPLIDRLERDGVFELEELRIVLDQLAHALDALHERGVIHRDIKAENLFIAGSGPGLHITLYDFGLARISSDSNAPVHGKLTSVGMRVGTNEYMSPEQMLNAADADHSADLWAVGVVAYLLLCASFPFNGKKVAELYGAVSQGDFERPSAVRDDLCAAIDGWFERCFAAQYERRFASAREQAAAFRAAMAARATGRAAGAQAAVTLPLPSSAPQASLQPVSIAQAPPWQHGLEVGAASGPPPLLQPLSLAGPQAPSQPASMPQSAGTIGALPTAHGEAPLVALQPPKRGRVVFVVLAIATVLAAAAAIRRFL
jgi:serine/threonine-protein kinase